MRRVHDSVDATVEAAGEAFGGGMRHACAGLLVLSLLLFLPSAARTECIQFEEHAGWVGAIAGRSGVFGIAAALPYVFCASGESGLVVYDVSDASRPQRFGALNLNGFANDALLLYQNRLVVSLVTGELCLIDVGVPASPRLIDRVKIGRSISQIARDLRNVYAAGGDEGMLVARWSDADRLEPGLPLSLPGRSVGIAIENHVAYVAAGASGLLVVNLAAQNGPRVIASRPSDGEATGVACAPSAAVLTDSSDGLLLLDVSDPARPLLRATHAQESHLPARPLLVDRQVFAPSEGNLLRIFDAGDADRLQPQATLSSGGRARCVSVAGGNVFFGDASGLWIASADPKVEVEATSSMRPRSAPTAISVSGRLFALAEPDLGVELLEVGHDGALTRQTWCDELTEPTGVALRPPYAFVATQSEGLVTIDFRNYLSPVVLSRGTGSFRLISLWGDRVVVAQGQEQWLYDISDPAAPVRRGFRQAAPPALQLIAAPGGLVIALESGMIELLDWSSPGEPRVVASIPQGDRIGTIALHGTDRLLYAHREVDAGPTTLELIDLADRSAPRAMWSLLLPSAVDQIASAPPYVYLSSAGSGVTLLDLSDPTHPIRAGNLTHGGTQVAAAEDHLLLASDEAIAVIPGECAANAPITLADLQATGEVGRIRVEWQSQPGLFDHFDIERAPVLAIGEPEFQAINADRPSSGEGPFRFDDLDVRPEAGYQYRVIGVTAEDEPYPLGPISVESPGALSGIFFSPYPTPARGEVTLRYYLPRRGAVELTILDVTGRLLRRWSIADAAPGGGVLRWSGDDARGRIVPGGVYFARLESGRDKETRRILWLR